MLFTSATSKNERSSRMILRRFSLPAPILLTIFALAPVLRAADGQIDLRIDPATGVAISASGSYVLVESVTMTAGVSAISLGGGASNVTIDLNGQTITGTGSGAGAHAINGGATTLHIYNGAISSFGGIGISLTTGDDLHAHDLRIFDCDGGGISCASRAKIERVNIVSCTGDGIVTASRAAIRDCIIENITGNGISVQTESLVSGCTVRSASVNGISVLAASKVTDSLVAYCGNMGVSLAGQSSAERVTVEGCQNGIVTGANCIVKGSAASFCQEYGIKADQNCLIEDCNASGNNTSGNFAGIYILSNSMVSNCIASNNVGSGNSRSTGIEAFLGGGCTIRGNVCNANVGSGTGRGTGIEVGLGSQVIGNTCVGNNGGSSAGADGIGINAAGSLNLLADNVCSANNGFASNGDGIGIRVGQSSTIRGNTCFVNLGNGTGISAGIYATLPRNTIQGNRCAEHTGSAAQNFGIFIDPTAGAGTSVIGNITYGNTNDGLNMPAAAYRAGNLYGTAEGVTGGTAGTVPGGADTPY